MHGSVGPTCAVAQVMRLRKPAGSRRRSGPARRASTLAGGDRPNPRAPAIRRQGHLCRRRGLLRPQRCRRVAADAALISQLAGSRYAYSGCARMSTAGSRSGRPWRIVQGGLDQAATWSRGAHGLHAAAQQPPRRQRQPARRQEIGLLPPAFPLRRSTSAPQWTRQLPHSRTSS